MSEARGACPRWALSRDVHQIPTALTCQGVGAAHNDDRLRSLDEEHLATVEHITVGGLADHNGVLWQKVQLGNQFGNADDSPVLLTFLRVSL